MRYFSCHWRAMLPREGWSQPGEPDYTPLWHEVIVTWKSGMTPTLLKSDTDVTAAVKQGKVTQTEPHIILNCPIVKVGH